MFLCNEVEGSRKSRRDPNLRSKSSEDGSRGVGSPVGAEPLSGVDVLMSERSSAEQWRCYYVLRIEDEVLVCVLSSSHPEPQEYMKSIHD